MGREQAPGEVALRPRVAELGEPAAAGQMVPACGYLSTAGVAVITRGSSNQIFVEWGKW